MTQFSSRVLRNATLALAAGALGACTSRLDAPPAKPIGVIQIDVNGDVTPTSTRPVATFIRALGLNIGDTRNPGDICQVVTFSETATTPVPVAGVTAGEAIALDLGGTTTQLIPSEQVVGVVYTPAAQASITFTPGDSATVHVPGAAGGFPAVTFSLKTAEPVIFTNPIPVLPPGSGTDMQVKWNAGDANSAMILSLRYQVANQTGMNQVLCLMKDDGDFTIPFDRLAGWEATTTTNRNAVASRLRNSGVGLEGATFFGSTSFRKTIPLAP